MHIAATPKERIRWAGLGTAVLLVFVAALTLLVAAGTEAQVGAETAGVGLVTDEGTLSDRGFNWLSYQGLLRAESDLGVVGTVYTSTSSADYGPNLQQCADDGNDLCISVGFFTAEAISNTASANPGTSFAIVDVVFENYPSNLRGMTFAAEGAGYLAGTLAGLMTGSDVVGGVGGMQIPPVETFLEPYGIAAQCANPDVSALVTYTWNFGDPDLGAEVAQDMMAAGADVIFAVAGPTGNGAVLTATQSGAWAIGVDTDQYVTLFMSGTVAGSDKLLSSAVKKLDNAVYDTIADVVAGTFTSGTAVYDLAAGGVGLAPFHETDPFVPQSVRDALDVVEQGIVDGTIDVYAPCVTYYIHLPLIARNSTQ
jgi:basic membrane lipoprotein Med (substrate-binding protein (PBP1-ABC) superfamily)